MLCELSFSDDLQFDEPNNSEIHMSKATGFTSTVSVKLDPTTGKLAGWDTLFNMTGNSSLELSNLGQVEERLKNPIYQIEQISAEKFKLYEKRKGTEDIITLVTDDTGNVQFEGLPQKCLSSLSSFSEDEKRTNPLTVLQSVIRVLMGTNKSDMEFDDD
jgi:hypothetical protein